MGIILQIFGLTIRFIQNWGKDQSYMNQDILNCSSVADQIFWMDVCNLIKKDYNVIIFQCIHMALH